MPHVNRPVGVRGILLAEVAVDFATAIHVQCIVPSVQIVAMRHRSLFSRVKTDPSIAVIVTGHNALTAQMTADHAGNFL